MIFEQYPQLMPLWQTVGLILVLLVFLAVWLLGMSLLQRQWGTGVLSGLLLFLSYVSEQLFIALYYCTSKLATRWIGMQLMQLPPLVLIGWTLLLLLLELLLLRVLVRQHRTHVSPASVKEAVDTLPTGICCYLPGGQVLLVNQAMEALCRDALGCSLQNGEVFRSRLEQGPYAPGCERLLAEGSRILVLPNGDARRISVQVASYEDQPLTVLLADEITEVYQKTLRLRENREQVARLNRRLAAYNREIVDLTIQQELLYTRIRLHDEMGADLLQVRRLIQSGGEIQERLELRQRLRQNVSFLQGQEAVPQDEYRLMLETAGKLGVRVQIEGTLPGTEPQKHIVATGIHECFTNTLRHGHGDLLTVRISETEQSICVDFTGNGEPPAGEITEKGGLHALRALTEQIGGTMTVGTQTGFSVTLTLPKEVPHALQGIDC